MEALQMNWGWGSKEKIRLAALAEERFSKSKFPSNMDSDTLMIVVYCRCQLVSVNMSLAASDAMEGGRGWRHVFNCARRTAYCFPPRWSIQMSM